jgi:hypothetical protein
MHHSRTRLQSFLDARQLAAVRVQEASGFSRTQFLRWRLGRCDIRREHMVRVLCAMRRVTGEEIRMDELFVLEPNAADCNCGGDADGRGS